MRKTKEKLRDEIFEAAQNNKDFLYNECFGVDLMMDALLSKLKKMNLSELESLAKKARDSRNSR